MPFCFTYGGGFKLPASSEFKYLDTILLKKAFFSVCSGSGLYSRFLVGDRIEDFFAGRLEV